MGEHVENTRQDKHRQIAAFWHERDPKQLHPQIIRQVSTVLSVRPVDNNQLMLPYGEHDYESYKCVECWNPVSVDSCTLFAVTN